MEETKRVYTEATPRLIDLHKIHGTKKCLDYRSVNHFDNTDINDETGYFSPFSLSEGGIYYKQRSYKKLSEQEFIDFMELEETVKDTVVSQVTDKYQERSKGGIDKYNTTLDKNPDGILTFLNHLQEELMDATLYIQKLKNQVEELKNKL